MLEDWLKVPHSSWAEFIEMQMPLLKKISDNIESSSKSKVVLPARTQVLRCLSSPRDAIKVIIVGQDPYPTLAYACGLAFAIDKSKNAMPKSLRNIKTELVSDVGCIDGNFLNLKSWQDQGVMLLNRVLTVNEGEVHSHKNLGWEQFTVNLLEYIDSRNKLVVILWGNAAGDLETFLINAKVVKSAHPSPLSAYRGFFGSKPFSKTNQLLSDMQIQQIDWCRALTSA